ncbi:MAG: hypothetical protein K8U03_24810 [Planctomycetia bacterium]|nr:hypothetical protein [Planctomycetia bacterium]
MGIRWSFRAVVAAAFAGLVAFSSASVSLAADDATKVEAAKPITLLLIGNSQCPTIVGQRLIENLAASDQGARPIKVVGCVKGGASLKSHWEAGTGPTTARGMIAAGPGAGAPWDFVVVQEIYNAQQPAFQPYARQFHELVQEHKAQIVFFGTASIISDFPKGFERLHRMHVDIGKELNVSIVDASQAYFRYLGENPAKEKIESLFATDKAHPGLQGSYLYSCGIYSVVTGRSPLGLAAPTAIPADIAKSLQEAAWAQYQATAAELKK